MLRLAVLSISLLFALNIYSQPGFKWSSDGTAIFADTDTAIVKFQFPSFTATEVVKTAWLTPAGVSSPLKLDDFSFSSDSLYLLIYTNSKKVWRGNTRGDYWLYNMKTGLLKQVGKNQPASSLMFAKIAPDNTKIAYVSKHDIYTEDLKTGKTTRLTKDGNDRLINGTFDWAYEEEFFCRDGFRWSPDSKSIAYWQIDARKIRNFLLLNNTDSLYAFTVPVEYPKVGEDPSACKIGVVNIATGITKWMNVPGDSKQHYIPRMEWAANSSEVILEQLNRKQNEAKIYLCNAVSGIATMIYTEKDKAWIDIKAAWNEEPTGWEWVNDGKEFLWVSEKDGWRHLYSISRNGQKETLITKGAYDIIKLNAIDEKAGYVYFLASPDNPIQQYLYRIRLTDGANPELLSDTALKGSHYYSVSPTGKYAYHRFSNHLEQKLIDWVNLENSKSVRTAYSQMTPNAEDGKKPVKVELITVTTDDNIVLDGWMIKPRLFDSTKKYPVLFYVYSEPGATTVKDAAGYAGTPLYAGDIAEDGYIQISFDTRGTPSPKGAAWRKSIYRKLGRLNIRDQAMAAQKVMQWSFVDTSRIAVHGWSGGGSTTLHLMFQYPEIYKTGIAIAPVADQLLYDNIYQERYMGIPQENREDFTAGSPLTYAKNLKGNLLVVHGTGDDNVHYQGTERLINELVKHGKLFSMMSYPNRTHSIDEGEGTTQHLSQLFTQYLKKHCPGGGR
ncbi:MAG: S9 family peptidase [Chitinophagaceae bacterium]|nr:S9 family peptidase [Chitinophagaceae bacterium]